ncbi:MAG: hypothetical protein ACJ8C4_07830 [Gemmataceae bacterium]
MPPPPPAVSELNREIIKHVEDDAPVRGEAENPDESRAYDYTVRFAHMVPEASFRAVAPNDLTFAHLMSPEAARYRGEVVQIEGRLKRVRDIQPTEGLRADGIGHLYEGWIFSEIYREYAWCVLFTELPQDIPVAEQLDRKVSFAGYFYKIYRYKSGDGTRRSPLLIGHTIASLKSPSTTASLWDIPGTVVPVALVVIGIGLVGLFSLTWWFRRNDRHAREAIRLARMTQESHHGPA